MSTNQCLVSGCSWNKPLLYARARHMAAEFKRKGVHVLLGPVVGPLGRVALGGRNWEGFSKCFVYLPIPSCSP